MKEGSIDEGVCATSPHLQFPGLGKLWGQAIKIYYSMEIRIMSVNCRVQTHGKLGYFVRKKWKIDIDFQSQLHTDETMFQWWLYFFHSWNFYNAVNVKTKGIKGWLRYCVRKNEK